MTLAEMFLVSIICIVPAVPVVATRHQARATAALPKQICPG